MKTRSFAGAQGMALCSGLPTALLAVSLQLDL